MGIQTTFSTQNNLSGQTLSSMEDDLKNLLLRKKTTSSSAVFLTAWFEIYYLKICQNICNIQQDKDLIISTTVADHQLQYPPSTP